MTKSIDTCELHWLSLSELSLLLCSRALSPVELVQHFLTRIERLDPKLHSYKLVLAESALAEAKRCESAKKQPQLPLCGIPFAVKDAFDVAGLPTTMGSRLMNNNVAREDAFIVRRLREAGMIVLGKTHMVQFAFGGVGVNNEDGTPLNPWSEEPRVAGGSSSGSAVAVAAGMAPMALGTDTAGSIRIPAALCGITGLKTTAGSIDMSGVAPLSWTLDSIGPLCRSVEDAVIVHSTVCGADIQAQDTGIKGMRIAFAETVFWDDVDAEVAHAVRATEHVFNDLGASVGSIPFEQAAETQRLNPNGLVASAEAYAVNRERIEHHFDECDPIVANRMISGREILAIDYIRAKQDWLGLRERVNKTLENIDALLVPTTAIPAARIEEVQASLDDYAKINRLYLRNTVIGNVLGLCGLSIPCGFTKSGLPIGLMIYGKPNQEHKIIRIGRAYQQSTDWHTRHPQNYISTI